MDDDVAGIDDTQTPCHLTFFGLAFAMIPDRIAGEVAFCEGLGCFDARLVVGSFGLDVAHPDIFGV